MMAMPGLENIKIIYSTKVEGLNVGMALPYSSSQISDHPFEITKSGYMSNPFKIVNKSKFGLYIPYKTSNEILYGATTVIMGTTLLEFSIRNQRPYLTAINKDQGIILLQQLKYYANYTIGKDESSDMVIDDNELNDAHIAINPLPTKILIQNMGELWVSVNDYILSNSQEIFRYGLFNYAKVVIGEDTQIISSASDDDHTKIIMQKYPGTT
jgi:hypothetical protein